MSNENPFKEFSVMLEDLVQSLDNQMPDLLSTVVMVELEAKHKQRIFGEGMNTDGEKIGEYSTKEGYYSKKEFVRKNAFKAQGKNGKKKFKNGKDKKSMFLVGGYSEFRDIQGRQTDYVDLKFTGSAERGIGIVKLGNATLYGTRDLVESKKLHGLTERFGEFLSLSQDEQEFLKNEITKEAIVVAKKTI